MTRKLVSIAVMMLLTSGAAYAQELVGAGRIEIESALFGGGALFMPSSGPHSTGYILDAAATANVGRRLGLEGDFAWAMTRRQGVPIDSSTLPNQRTPNMLFYTGNLVVSPLGHRHPFVPYLEFGGGAMSVLDTSTTGGFGLEGHTTHLVATAGGGIRWFPIPHWGMRADYRFIGIRNDSFPATTGVIPIHHAQRVFGALVITF